MYMYMYMYVHVYVCIYIYIYIYIYKGAVVPQPALRAAEEGVHGRHLHAARRPLRAYYLCV